MVDDRYKVIFNNNNDRELGIAAIERPVIPFPEKNIESIQIEGRDGSLTIDEETYKDIEIPMEFNMFNKINFNEKCREIKKWFNIIKDNRLQFSDDLEVFYKVKKCKCNDIKREMQDYGKFSVTFVCDPYAYYIDGTYEVDLLINPSIYNYSMLAKPSFLIKGEGNVTIKMNGNTFEINVGQKVMIDTDLELTYRDDKISNISVIGEYRNLFLLEGKNEFSWSVGTGGNIDKFIMIPNLRTI